MATYHVKGELSKMSNFVHFRHFHFEKSDLCQPLPGASFLLIKQGFKDLTIQCEWVFVSKNDWMTCFFPYSYTCSGRIRTQWNQLVMTRGFGSQIQNGRRIINVVKYIIYMLFCFVFKWVDCIWYMACWCGFHAVKRSSWFSEKKIWHFLAFLTRTEW